MVYEVSGLIPIAIAFVMAYIGFNINEEHKPMRFFFILLSLWMLVLSFANAIELINCVGQCGAVTDVVRNLEIGYKGTMWLAVFGSIYFTLMLLYGIVLWLIDLVRTKPRF